jgi:phosphotransferase system IIB component
LCVSESHTPIATAELKLSARRFNIRTPLSDGCAARLRYSHAEAEKVDPPSLKKTIREAEGNHVQALKGAIADAQQNIAASNA